MSEKEKAGQQEAEEQVTDKSSEKSLKDKVKDVFSKSEKEEKTDQVEEEAQEEVSELDQVTAELAELKDKHLRLIAEYDNYKRRSTKERIEYLKTAGKDVIIDLLPVLDDFDRGAMSMEEAKDMEAVKAGFTLVREKLNAILEKKGLAEIEAKGEEFDADKYEAITEIPAGEEMAGKVVDVVTKGYTLNSSIIRFAQVVVGQKQ